MLPLGGEHSMVNASLPCESTGKLFLDADLIRPHCRHVFVRYVKLTWGPFSFRCSYVDVAAIPPIA
jgi:hypothetical protein